MNVEHGIPSTNIHQFGDVTHKIEKLPVTRENNSPKKYIWASITELKVGLNYGNYLIEECLKYILQLPEPNLVVDVFQSEFPRNLGDYQFVINPGCTNLTPFDTLAFRKLPTETTPIICFGGSIFFGGRLWRLRKLKHRNLTVQIAGKMWQPVGCRDPFTYDLLTSHHIKAQFIGCPTLFYQGNSLPGDHIAFSFSRNNIPEQIKLLHHLSNNQRVKVLIHEAREEKYCQNLRVEIVKDISSFLAVYYSSKCVITGRLHGALPGISALKPVFYFQGTPIFDTRLTLLKYLGLPIQNINEMYSIDGSAINYDFAKVTSLKESFSNYVKAFKGEFNL